MRIFVVVVVIALSQWAVCGDQSQSKLNDGLRLGDSWRLRSVLRKALRGERLQIAVIGGSNSAGGGFTEDGSPFDGLYYNIFSKWWDSNIGRKNGPFLRKYILAIGGTGGYSFAFCYKTFIPGRDKVLDILLVEQSVNFNMIGKADPLEQLTRQLLVHPSNPAIIFINLFSGGGNDTRTGNIINSRCSNLEDYGQIDVESHYNITSISLRDIICPVSKAGIRQLKETDMYSSDGKHVGAKGHFLVAQTLINYVRDTLSDVTVQRPEVIRQVPIIPRPILEEVSLVAPLCWTYVTPDKSQDFRPSLIVDVESRSGFWLRVEKGDSSLRTDAQGGWVAKDVGSSVVFRVLVPPYSSLRSVILLIHTLGNGGKAQAWLDDNEDAKVEINNKSKFGQNVLFTVFTRVTPGYHYVTVKLVDRGYFMVSGLLVGPPDLDVKNVT